MTMFHPNTCKEVKLCHAFCIYDRDNDGFLGLEDLKWVVKRMTGNELSQDGEGLVKAKNSLEI